MQTSADENLQGHDAEVARLLRENQALRAELATARADGAGHDPLRALADALPAIVWGTDAAGATTFLNLAWVAYTGEASEASIARGPATFIHPEDVPAAMASRAASLASGEPTAFEYRLRRADGAYRWHLARLVPARDAVGRVVAWYGTATDVHDLKETEARLTAAEERARAITEQAMFSVQILAPDGRTLAVNRAWERLWGIGLADLEALGHNMLADPQLEAKGIAPFIRRGFAGEACAIPVIPYDTVESGLPGATPHVRAFIYPVRDAAGAIREVVLMHEDVTAQVAAEQALHAAHEALEAQAAALEQEVARRTAELAEANDALRAQKTLLDRIVRHAPVAMAFLDQDLVYRWNNPRHSEVVGLPAEAIVGRPVQAVVPAEALATSLPLYAEALRSGEPHIGHGLPLPVAGGQAATYWDYSFVPVPGEDGHPRGLLVLVVDVTHRVEHERLRDAQIAALREADQAKDEFLSVISHELRTPLNFIMGFASTLADGLQGPISDAQQDAVRRILNGADRMLLLVNDLLDFAKIRSGRFDLVPAPTAVPPLVAEVLGLLAPLAAQKAVTFAPGPQAEVVATIDATRVAQVLTNLVSNAIKFSPPGGVVEVESEVRDARLVIRVRDAGPGIAPEDLPRLFHRFSQLDMSSTRPAGGTGLGLAISKALVEAQGGEIGVTSVPGAGSTFWFALPLEA